MSNNYLEKNKLRALRRYNKQKKKDYVLKNIILKRFQYDPENISSFEDQDIQKKDYEKSAAMLYQHPCSCSCSMCGNPRNCKWYNGLTLKELAFEDKFHPENLRLKNYIL